MLVEEDASISKNPWSWLTLELNWPNSAISEKKYDVLYNYI